MTLEKIAVLTDDEIRETFPHGALEIYDPYPLRGWYPADRSRVTQQFIREGYPYRTAQQIIDHFPREQSL